jgi:chemotaxis protein MotB
MPRGHGRRRHGGAEEGSNERWLLTYADMITLLMALFMVLFSISSVNISKYQTLQKSLKAAFSGNILPGGKAVAQQGATDNAAQTPASVELQAIEPVKTEGSASLQNSSLHGASATTASSPTSTSASAAAAALKQAAAQNQAAEFARIKRELDAYAASHGFAKSVQTTIEARGLVIRVLTDDLLFASGKAALEGRAGGLLAEIAQLLNVDQTHPISVEGNTDNVPIHSSQFPSNWELSTARASTVVRFLIVHGIGAGRLTATGNAEQRPFDSNATAAGRARNRRVEIVMRRISAAEDEGAQEP